MQAICPNDPNHKRFSTTAHVMEEWEVDAEGNFVRTIEVLQVDHGPDPDNEWACLECGAQAKVLTAPETPYREPVPSDEELAALRRGFNWASEHGWEDEP